MNSQEAREVRYLEEQCKAASDQLFKKRKQLQALQTDREEDERRLKQITEQGGQLREHLAHLENAHGQVGSELQEQDGKLQNLYAVVQDMSLQHRADRGVPEDEDTLDEKMFRAELLNETNANVLFTLGQLAKEFPEMHEALHMGLQNAGLRVPSRPPSRVSSRGNTAGSALSGGNAWGPSGSQ